MLYVLDVFPFFLNVLSCYCDFIIAPLPLCIPFSCYSWLMTNEKKLWDCYWIIIHTYCIIICVLYNKIIMHMLTGDIDCDRGLLMYKNKFCYLFEVPWRLRNSVLITCILIKGVRDTQGSQIWLKYVLIGFICRVKVQVCQPFLQTAHCVTLSWSNGNLHVKIAREKYCYCKLLS